MSYDSHVISRRRMADELPRVGAAEGGGGAGRSQELLDTEIARVGRELYCTVLYFTVVYCAALYLTMLYCAVQVSRELYKAFSGKNPGFAEVSDGRGGAGQSYRAVSCRPGTRSS